MHRAIVTTILTSSLFLLITLAAVPLIDTRTILPLTNILAPILQPQDEVATYHQYYQDLPFYLRRRVSIVNWRNELSYGMQHQITTDWMINEDTFWKRWHSKHRIFAIMNINDYAKLQKKYPHEKIYVWGHTPINILISNKKSSHIFSKEAISPLA
jgi:hypothetical protein